MHHLNVKLRALREHDLKNKRKKKLPSFAKPTSHKRQAREARRSSLKKIPLFPDFILTDLLIFSSGVDAGS